MSDIKLPPISRELVAVLDALYPERCPDLDDSDRAIWVTVGQRQVVRFIMTQFALQQEMSRHLHPEDGGGDLPLHNLIPSKENA